MLLRPRAAKEITIVTEILGENSQPPPNKCHSGTRTHSKTLAYSWLFDATPICMRAKNVAPVPAIHMSKNDPPNARGQMSADRQNESAQRVNEP